ncbi:MAG: hypothetical protein AB1486_29230 [Planctomycetota bacterium]
MSRPIPSHESEAASSPASPGDKTSARVELATQQARAPCDVIATTGRDLPGGGGVTGLPLDREISSCTADPVHVGGPGSVGFRRFA